MSPIVLNSASGLATVENSSKKQNDGLQMLTQMAALLYEKYCWAFSGGCELCIS